MSLPIIFTIAAWLAVYGGGNVWLWRTRGWAPRSHLMLFAATMPILLIGLVVAGWGSGEAIAFVLIAFPLNVVPLITVIWLGIRRREREDDARDTDLRWNMKS